MTASEEHRRILPMFPLGSVTAPGSVLPLQVFEPRYRLLVQDCIDADGRFGTVLIERGSEVGGGDQRCAIGSLVSMLEVGPGFGGRISVVGAAMERLRVVEWLEDDGDPRALVEPHPDDEVDDLTPGVLAAATTAVEEFLGRATELGIPLDPTVALPDDAGLASHVLCARSPLGPLDRQRLLEAAGPTARLALLVALMDGQIDLLEARRSQN